jgi:hypothetical protein
MKSSFDLHGPAAQYFERCLDSAQYLDENYAGNEVAVGQYYAAMICDTTSPKAASKPTFRQTTVTLAFEIDLLRKARRTRH